MNLHLISRLSYFLSFILIFNILNAQDNSRPKYIFLFIGDGMGVAQVNTTEAYLAAIEGSKGFEHLSFTEFPVFGLCETYAANRLITCSAAAGTALATGNKTNINWISMNPADSSEYVTIAEKAKQKKYKVGIITSVSIDHATPAVFYAHETDRNNYFEIGLDLANSSVDFIGGGGFLEPEGIFQDKKVNVWDEVKKKGFTVINSISDFNELKELRGKVIVSAPVLAEEAALPFSIDSDDNDLSLAEITSKAIELLENETGFFMMVEGGKIDWACHGNDPGTLVNDVIAFDEAVKEAVEFMEKHPSETLIIVTADHETGGLALGNKQMSYESNLKILQYQDLSSGELLKRVRALKASNDTSFSSILALLNKHLGFNDINKVPLYSHEMITLAEKWSQSLEAEKNAGDENPYGESDPLVKEAFRLFNQKAGIGWTSSSHTAINVPVYAIGAGAEKFSGLIDNTDIPKLIEEIWE